MEKLLMLGIPAPKVEPTYDQAVRLMTEVGRLRDEINRHLVRYWDWSQVKDFSIAKRLDCLSGLSLHYSAKIDKHEAPEALKPLDNSDPVSW